jgi:hypothetical protein
MSTDWRSALLALALLPWTSLGHAQSATPEDRLRAALRDTTRQLRDAQDELASLRAENASLKQQAAAAPKAKACPATPDISPVARRQIDRLVAENEQLRRYADDAQKIIAKWQDAQAQWQTGLQQANQHAQTNEAAAKGLQDKLESLQKQEQETLAGQKKCIANNSELVKISADLLERYRDKGFWDLIGNSEPITKIHRVRFETLLQEYSGKIQDNEIAPGKVVEHENVNRN